MIHLHLQQAQHPADTHVSQRLKFLHCGCWPVEAVHAHRLPVRMKLLQCEQQKCMCTMMKSSFIWRMVSPSWGGENGEERGRREPGEER